MGKAAAPRTSLRLIGYARVSTDDQRLDLQIDALTRAGVEPEDIWTDTASGLTVARPGLTGVLKAVQPGNVLMVWKFDRLARSTLELLKIADQLKRKGIGLRSLTQGIDTSGPAGALVFAVLAAVAEIEATMISERTIAGMEAARARGIHLGRPRKLTDKQCAMIETLLRNRHGGQTARQIAEQFGVERTTMYRALREHRTRMGRA
ncbi:recombinase family protein [Azospirillum brasilense]|uniref:Recombinase family protein n=1 Tax=Azospirillum brasilense TaxID=192 RepID=A0A6L3B5B6_AZOBR|nr:recombinase family protein [Azospirillum brasilense]KAA0688195.1 recombinase family protein [Azospirillum brasilense]